ncbi:H-type small acid-soluble spore protein [Hazenella sp. IB182357]|uniref:H-type small acid-soluble spore protein n=1 Tax=Polycladospora coralii TaxID=2771432 RepID=A0A926RSY4_9BACL|nr:H-type small acid-soluble spore protein [Polycladospora coralii]MBD1370948.1 H-type small acid-soluble spore protein [Polycladospora coralii]MBS7529887.1 H-type small acid-soluble spore protein [Polycladospora coralii]
MDSERLKEILREKKKIEVHFHGTPVWIKKFDSCSQTALVHSILNPVHQMQVKVDDLKEV